MNAPNETVAKALQATLVELIDLALVGKQAHWSVVGPQFRSIHLELDEIKRERKLPKMSGEGVLLVHGITRSSKSMSGYREPLEKAGLRYID